MSKYEFRGLNHRVIENLDIDINKNSVNVILGKSGVGKTTLLHKLINEFKSQGVQNISYAFQNDTLIEWLTVKDNLALVMNKPDSKRIEDVLTALNIREYLKQYPKKLSGGIRQRVNLARAFLHDSEVIILDETFNSLDYLTKAIALEFVKEHIANKTLIIVTHDLDVAIYFESNINILYKTDKSYVKIIENSGSTLTVSRLMKEIKSLKE